MSEWIRSILDLVLIVMVGAGLIQAARLIKHLAGLRQGRLEMERFVYEFNATVVRAEAGIKGLRSAARESGDDLEKLVEKAVLLRDELHLIVESADQIAERLSKSASAATKPEAKKPDAKPAAAPTAPVSAAAKADAKVVAELKASEPQPTSRAEKELLQALQKLS